MGLASRLVCKTSITVDRVCCGGFNSHYPSPMADSYQQKTGDLARVL